MSYAFFPFEPSRRLKYDDKMKMRILYLKDKGHSIRDIAKILEIPFGSIHYILRKSGLVTLNSNRPSLNYLDRKQVNYMYNVSSKTFDYLRGRYHDKFVKVGLRVYGHFSVFEDYYYRVNYSKANTINASKRRNKNKH